MAPNEGLAAPSLRYRRWRRVRRQVASEGTEGSGAGSRRIDARSWLAVRGQDAGPGSSTGARGNDPIFDRRTPLIDEWASPEHPPGDAIETFVRGEDAERSAEELRR